MTILYLFILLINYLWLSLAYSRLQLAKVFPAIWRWPAVGCNVSTTAAGQGRADSIESKADSLGRRGLN